MQVPRTAKQEIVQSIGLSFAAATLYLLVQPRPQNQEDVTSSPVQASFSNVQDFLFFDCVGWPVHNQLPSNSYLYHESGLGSFDGCCLGQGLEAGGCVGSGCSAGCVGAECGGGGCFGGW